MSYSSTKSIMLVDDDQDDKYFFYKAMQEVDDSVALYSACDGVDAMEKLQFIMPDLILLDLTMPRMNGITFLKERKKDKRLRSIPVIVYTSDLSLFDENEVMKLGAYQVIVKPAEYRSTVQTIASILETRFIRMSA
jgi:CheY-like chemotaxis protein